MKSNNDFFCGCILMYTRPNEATVRLKVKKDVPQDMDIEVLLFEHHTGRMVGEASKFELRPCVPELRGSMLLTAELRLGHYDVVVLKDRQLTAAFDCHHKKFDEKGTLARRCEVGLLHIERVMRRDRTPLPPRVVMQEDLREAMDELDGMVGLDDLKSQLRRIFQSVCFNRQRKEMGLPTVGERMYHCIFSGNPGTGKTTVARLLGRVLYKMGVLSNGDVICHDRRSLVGQYIGETETKFSEVLDKAHGNVLFIDEAYSLFTTDSDAKDYGRHIIESLLTAVTDPECDMVVVLAGYKDEMQRLLESNPGLSSRFAYQFTFDDYDPSQLMLMAQRLLARHRLVPTPEAAVRLEQVLRQAVGQRDRYFGNGRWLTTFVEQYVVQAMAERVMQHGFLTRDMLCMVQAADIERAAQSDSYLQRQNVKTSRRIGFVA